MDGAFWGVIAGIVALVFGRVLWLALRPATATEVSGVSADDEALFLPEAATGAEGVLSRFFVECELNWTPGGFVAWCIALVGASYLLASFWGISEGWFLFVLVTLLIIAVAFLFGRRNRRLNDLRNQLPDVVSLLARSSRAGLEFQEALGLCQKMARGRLQGELQHCRRQLGLGRTVSGAMESLARRLQLKELGLLATVLAVHRQTGGALADALDRLSTLLRDRIQFRRQMTAASSGGRLSALLIAPAAPLLFAVLLLLNPEHVQVFFSTGLGRVFLGLGVLLNLSGIVWILGLIRMPR